MPASTTSRFNRKSPVQRSFIAAYVVPLLAYLLVCQTTASVLLAFSEYFPPNFRSDFLLGRQTYFFGPYQWAFYVHILSGPFTLISGLVLISDSVRRRFPALHRQLGRVQLTCVLFLVTPSGLWLAWYAATGQVAAAGFATLAILTAFCAAMGWTTALQRRFDQHRLWMLRCYALLCSAVVLRVIGGLSDVLGAEWTYPFAAWLSWLLPLLVLESLRFSRPSLHLQ
jgi:hypothetical protein